MNKLQELQDRIVNWRNSLPSSPSTNGTVEHLIEEAEHLVANPYDPYNLADVGILWLSLCSLAGFTADEMLDALDAKVTINENREWLEPDELGIIRHK
jgi:hypothetical protein